VRSPADWPDRPAFATFRVTTEVKPDGRRVHYYDWPGETKPPAANDENPSEHTIPQPVGDRDV
jgi:hypothetical protein